MEIDATKQEVKKNNTPVTPFKYGMKQWSPQECNFLDHLTRLDMGLKQAEEKNCSLITRQNLVIMTLPQEFGYVNQFITEDNRTSMSTFKKKLVELIIGSNVDQTEKLLTT